eukprot:jgi/Bigna1/131442/aug1.14_g6150
MILVMVSSGSRHEMEMVLTQMEKRNVRVDVIVATKNYRILLITHTPRLEEEREGFNGASERSVNDVMTAVLLGLFLILVWVERCKSEHSLDGGRAVVLEKRDPHLSSQENFLEERNARRLALLLEDDKYNDLNAKVPTPNYEAHAATLRTEESFRSQQNEDDGDDDEDHGIENKILDIPMAQQQSPYAATTKPIKFGLDGGVEEMRKQDKDDDDGDDDDDADDGDDDDDKNDDGDDTDDKDDEDDDDEGCASPAHGQAAKKVQEHGRIPNGKEECDNHEEEMHEGGEDGPNNRAASAGGEESSEESVITFLLPVTSADRNALDLGWLNADQEEENENLAMYSDTNRGKLDYDEFMSAFHKLQQDSSSQGAGGKNNDMKLGEDEEDEEEARRRRNILLFDDYTDVGKGASLVHQQQNQKHGAVSLPTSPPPPPAAAVGRSPPGVVRRGRKPGPTPARSPRMKMMKFPTSFPRCFPSNPPEQNLLQSNKKKEGNDGDDDDQLNEEEKMVRDYNRMVAAASNDGTAAANSAVVWEDREAAAAILKSMGGNDDDDDNKDDYAPIGTHHNKREGGSRRGRRPLDGDRWSKMKARAQQGLVGAVEKDKDNGRYGEMTSRAANHQEGEKAGITVDPLDPRMWLDSVKHGFVNGWGDKGREHEDIRQHQGPRFGKVHLQPRTLVSWLPEGGTLLKGKKIEEFAGGLRYGKILNRKQYEQTMRKQAVLLDVRPGEYDLHAASQERWKQAGSVKNHVLDHHEHYLAASKLPKIPPPTCPPPRPREKFAEMKNDWMSYATT